MNTSESPSELMDFEVLIPTMDGHGIADRITIQVPVTRNQLRTMAEWKPQSVLCLDVAFKGNDALKVNADLEFQSYGIKFATA